MYYLRSFGVGLCLAGVMCVVSWVPLLYVLGTAWGQRQEAVLGAKMYRADVPEYLSARIVLMFAPIAVGAILIVAGLPLIRRLTRQA